MRLRAPRATRFLLLAAAVGLAAAAPASANLITNPGGEADVGSGASYANIVVTGFAPETGAFTLVKYGSGAFPSTAISARVGGGANFFAGGGAALSTGEQRIDLSASAATIDAGLGSYNLAALLGGYASQEDNARLDAQFLGAGDAPLSSVSIGPVTAAERSNQTNLLPRGVSGTLPVGTRAVRIVLTLTRVSGSSNDGYADNLSFTVATSAGAASDVPLPAATPLLARTGTVGTLPGGAKTVSVTPSTACQLTATTKFSVPVATKRASERAVGRRLVSVYVVPGARITVPPVRVTALVPKTPVVIPVKPVTVRVQTPVARRVVNPPPVPTVTTVTCRPLVGVLSSPSTGLNVTPTLRAGGVTPRPVTVPARVDPPPAPATDAKLTAGVWGGPVREVFAPAPAGRVSFSVLADGTVEDFSALGAAERCYSTAGQAQGGAVVSQPFFVGVDLNAKIRVPAGRLPKTATFSYAPATASPSGVEYVRIASPGLVFDAAGSAYGTVEAFRRLGGSAYCQLRFSFTARPGGGLATGTAGFVYTD